MKQTLTDVHQQFADFFPSDALRRYAYLVSKKLAEGHICIGLDEADAYFQEEGIFSEPSGLHNNAWVGTDNKIKKPFVLHGNYFYLQRYFAYETEILERIGKFLQSNNDGNRSALNANTKIVDTLFDKNTPAEKWQKIAAISAVQNNLTIITGGPGTGKTTTVAKILAVLYSIKANLKVALVAPTGKAAVRMAESLRSASGLIPAATREKFAGLQPQTIHRLLGPKKDSPYFKHDHANPLNYDLVIVDESSMIDAAMFAKLLNAIGDATRLIMLGDKNQLASVEAGSLFGDLCNSIADPENTGKAEVDPVQSSSTSQLDLFPVNRLSNYIVELKESFRFSAGKGIGKFSKAVIENDQIIIKSFIESSTDDQVIIDTKYDEELFVGFAKAYEEYIAEQDIKSAIKKFNNVRILCATRNGDHGVHAVNKKVEKYLKLKTAAEFYEHRPIIVTKNYYELELFNGDVGIIRKDDSGNLRAWFEDDKGGIKSVAPGFIAESETVFAMTIHKSQGSEYEQVLVLLPDKEMPLLTAELLYTGVTRARTKVLIQSAEDVLLASAAKRVKRASGIIERLKEEKML